MTGDDNLFRRVDIRRLTDLALRGLTANSSDRIQIHPQDCGHCTYADRNRLLHVFAAISHGADRVGKTDRACCHVCGILAQAMSRDEVCLNASFVQHTPGCDRDRQNGRLRIFCQTKLIFGPFEATLRNAVPESIIGLLERLLCNWISLGQFPAHADSLGALTGEEKSGRGATHRRSRHSKRILSYGLTVAGAVEERKPASPFSML